jgi:4-hydroxy-3-methylbut-2-enyl diphosphate reductase
MLMSDSLAIADMLRQAMVDRYGELDLGSRFRAFDTICSATQERQDAIVALLGDHRPDLALVIGGYNSSNTCNLARICAEQVATYHIANADCLSLPGAIRHRPVGAPSTAVVRETTTDGWLPAGAVTIGLTAGASTPNNIVGQVVERLQELVEGG